MFGYGVMLASGLMGLWTAVLIFTLPTIWRHNVLLSRTKTDRTTRDLLRSIATAVDIKNGNSAAHASSVATTAVAVAREIGKSEGFVEEIETAAILHDIGKASWSNKVLAQRASWDPKQERYRYIHPDMSAEIAIWAGYPRSVAGMIRSHHEYFDGSGYTQGLKGDEIPIGGRILCAADSFGSMLQAGDPRFARTLPEAVREMRFGTGKQFDPEVVEALLSVLEKAVFNEPAELQPVKLTRIEEDLSVSA
jgi:putative nucleotidyltransferase with HDIG domain